MNDNADRPLQARLQEALSIVKWLDCSESDLETVQKAIPAEIKTHKSMQALLDRLAAAGCDEESDMMLRAICQLSEDPRALAEMRELASELVFIPDFMRAVTETMF